MSSSHFCTSCRCWVRKPWVRDVNYYLNERHSEIEDACDYHEQESPARKWEDPMKIVKQVQSPAQPGLTHSKYIQDIFNSKPLKREINEKKNYNNIVCILIFILALILLLWNKIFSIFR